MTGFTRAAMSICSTMGLSCFVGLSMVTAVCAVPSGWVGAQAGVGSAFSAGSGGSA